MSWSFKKLCVMDPDSGLYTFPIEDVNSGIIEYRLNPPEPNKLYREDDVGVAIETDDGIVIYSFKDMASMLAKAMREQKEHQIGPIIAALYAAKNVVTPSTPQEGLEALQRFTLG